MSIVEITGWIMEHPGIFFGFYLILLPTLAVVIFALLVRFANKGDK